jgi:prepilin-type N-terminal cleavage/methylation domain-containing protein
MLLSTGPLVSNRAIRRRPQTAGYSLAEMLIVVAIIGVLSLLSVPAFMNYQRANSFRSAARTFTADLRAARAMAIQQSFDVRVEFTMGGIGSRDYSFYSSRDGTTWTPIKLRGGATSTAVASAGSNTRRLENKIWFQTLPASTFQDIGSNTKPDIIFKPSGAIAFDGTNTSGSVIIATDWAKLRNNRYYVNMTSSGQIRMTTSQCSDRIDNDGDGRIDFGGTNADSQCSNIEDNDEST